MEFDIGDKVYSEDYDSEAIITEVIVDKDYPTSYKFKLLKGAGSSGHSYGKDLQLVESEKDKGVCAATGSLRYNNGKPECHHIHPRFLIALADLMTDSAKKYETYNYMKGQPYSVPYNSLMRHIQAFMDGENKDSESGRSHLLHAAANCLILWVTQEYQIKNHPELDDRYKKVLGIEESRED